MSRARWLAVNWSAEEILLDLELTEAGTEHAEVLALAMNMRAVRDAFN
jgi:hypothetical protein